MLNETRTNKNLKSALETLRTATFSSNKNCSEREEYSGWTFFETSCFNIRGDRCCGVCRIPALIKIQIMSRDASADIKKVLKIVLMRMVGNGLGRVLNVLGCFWVGAYAEV